MVCGSSSRGTSAPLNDTLPLVFVSPELVRSGRLTGEPTHRADILAHDEGPPTSWGHTMETHVGQGADQGARREDRLQLVVPRRRPWRQLRWSGADCSEVNLQSVG